MFPPITYTQTETANPRREAKAILIAVVSSLAFVVLTRWPVRRLGPIEYDDFHFLATIRDYSFPMHHTLFLAFGRAFGGITGDAYLGFVVLDMLVSALALVSVWWWLSALVRPRVAVAATLVVGVAPVFWAYGAMAGNYSAIVLVGSFLLGVAIRSWRAPQSWHPYAAAAVLAAGTGYRQDLGTYWLPVFLLILWRHRWRPALQAAALFAGMNLVWIGLMLHDVGGWAKYREGSAAFAHNAGYLNSFWNLGVKDAPLRYAVKACMALVWTLGPGLVFVPRGLRRLVRAPEGVVLIGLLAISVIPALGSHLLVHFGVAGYCFHYVPALIALVALGIGRSSTSSVDAPDSQAVPRLIALAAILAAVFWFYPTNYADPGARGDFDMAFARHTRVALRTGPPPGRTPRAWRTDNSIVVRESPARRQGGERAARPD
jgi:hypothetical protein